MSKPNLQSTVDAMPDRSRQSTSNQIARSGTNLMWFMEMMMSPKRRLLAGTIVCAGFFGLFAAGARAESACREPEEGSKHAPIISPPTMNVVTGTGRLQFYSAPSVACAMNGTFVIPKDELTAYVRTDSGWTSVMYMNPRTGDSVLGWVRSNRLKETGTIAPKQ